MIIRSRFKSLTLILAMGYFLTALNFQVLGASCLQERIIADPNSCTAIYGFDPVSYFIDQKAIKGSKDYEFSWNGVIWSFSSAANMAVFIDYPNYYIPGFGGYDPLALANNNLVKGSPSFWLIADSRLYLFSSSENRQEFRDQLKTIVRQASAKWVVLQRDLVPAN